MKAVAGAGCAAAERLESAIARTKTNETRVEILWIAGAKVSSTLSSRKYIQAYLADFSFSNGSGNETGAADINYLVYRGSRK
jgi:hypothetical protein